MNDDRVIVVFRNRSFAVTRRNEAELHAAMTYGIDHGVPEEQIQLAQLFDDPFA